MQEVSVEKVEKWHKGNEIWAIVVLEKSQEGNHEEIPEPIQTVLQQFESVFQDPKQLPPHRVFDHSITITPEGTYVNSKPYRYSPLQKDEIERQVSEMIQTGIVTPSLSPSHHQYC